MFLVFQIWSMVILSFTDLVNKGSCVVEIHLQFDYPDFSFLHDIFTNRKAGGTVLILMKQFGHIFNKWFQLLVVCYDHMEF